MDFPSRIYKWFPTYREAILETDHAKMQARLLIAEKKMVERLHVLAQDHGGTVEERKALADALNGIKNLRVETSRWSSVAGSDMT